MGFRFSVLGIRATAGPAVVSLWSLLLWIREEAEGIREVKGLSWRVFPHSEAQVATGKGLRILYSKPVTLVLGQGFEDLEQQWEL